MTSTSDDPQGQLRQNLKLRCELAAEVAKAREAVGSLSALAGLSPGVV
jgi:hypothetical protein